MKKPKAGGKPVIEAPEQEPKRNLALWAILAAHAVFAIAAALVVPTDYGAQVRLTPPDETAHIAIVQYLVDHHSLPVFTSGSGLYEAHQPPLFYLSCVPGYMLGRALGGGEFGRFGIILLRLWSALWGAVTVWAVWMVAGRLQMTAASPPRPPSPSRRRSASFDSGGGGRRAGGARRCQSLQVLATGLAALLPGHVFITSAISNDAMSEAFCALALLLCVVCVQEGRLPARRALLLGLVTGLALLTKTNSLALALVVLVALALVQRREGTQAEVTRGLGIVVGCVLVLWGWWMARNMALYGEPLAMKTFVEVFGKDRPGPDYFAKIGLSGVQYFQLVSWQTALSFWGIFGQANVFMPKPFYVVGHVLAAVALIGLAWAGLRGRSGEGAEASGPDLAWWVIWAQLILTVALFYRFNADFFQAQARYLFPATGAWACVLGAGWAGWRARWMAPAVLAVLAVLASWAIVAFATGDVGAAAGVMGG